MIPHSRALLAGVLGSLLAALGRRVYAIEGGSSPGRFFFSNAIEFLGVPPRR